MSEYSIQFVGKIYNLIFLYRTVVIFAFEYHMCMSVIAIGSIDFENNIECNKVLSFIAEIFFLPMYLTKVRGIYTVYKRIIIYFIYEIFVQTFF